LASWSPNWTSNRPDRQASQEFGFSEITLTPIYAVHVVGNVVALLLFGRLSDQLGRKRVTLPALGLAASSALAISASISRLSGAWIAG
jgi:MFS family permease